MNKKRKYRHAAMTSVTLAIAVIIKKKEGFAMNKKRKYGYAAMTSAALAIAVVILINIIAAVASNKVSLSLDLTKDSVLDFNQQTKDVISELDMDVRIISLIPKDDTNREMTQLDEILEKYDALSNHITYERADAKKNPALLSSYKVNGEPLTDSYNIIFETDRMHTVVSVNDIILFLKDNINGNYVSGALLAEQHFTSALLKVTKGSDINAYISTGHGEKFDAEEFKTNILPGTGYIFHDISFMSSDIPKDADVVIIASPQTDYSADEVEKINSYLMNGGSVQLFVDPTTPPLNNLFTLLGEWGIEIGDGLLADDDASHYAKYRTSLIADLIENDMTNSMPSGNMQIIFPVSRPVKAENKNDITAYRVASTSDKGYIKSDIYSMYDTFEQGDTKAQSDVAVMATRPNYEGRMPKLFVSGSVAFLEVRSNTNFYTNLMATMTDQPYSIYIQPKNILESRVTINQALVYVYVFITAILIPILIISFGLITWIKRRHL